MSRRESIWKVVCQVCGRVILNTVAKKRWDNLIVCPNDWEQRHPLLRSGPHSRHHPGGEGSAAGRSGGVRTEPDDQSVLVCDLYSSMGLAGWGTTGCARTGTYNRTQALLNDIVVFDPVLDPWQFGTGVIYTNIAPTDGSTITLSNSGSAMTIEFYITVHSYTESSNGAVSPRWDILEFKQNSTINGRIYLPGAAYSAPGIVDDSGYNVSTWNLHSNKASTRFYHTLVLTGSFSLFWENGIYHSEFAPGSSLPTFNNIAVGQSADPGHKTTFTMEYLRISNIAKYTAGVDFTPPI